jgi:hypothetical protein
MLAQSHIPHHRHIHRLTTLATLVAFPCSFKTIFTHDFFRSLVINSAFQAIFYTPSFCYKDKVLRRPVEVAAKSGHLPFSENQRSGSSKVIPTPASAVRSR